MGGIKHTGQELKHKFAEEGEGAQPKGQKEQDESPKQQEEAFQLIAYVEKACWSVFEDGCSHMTV